MKTFIGLILWCVLFVLCWPVALIALILFPLIWLIALPFRIVGFTLDAVFKLITSLITLPFRAIR